VGAVGALGQVGRLAAALAAAAVREQHRIDAFFAVARAKAALARLAEHAVDAAGALLDLHAADVGARYLVGLLQAPQLGNEVLFSHVGGTIPHLCRVATVRRTGRRGAGRAASQGPPPLA